MLLLLLELLLLLVLLMLLLLLLLRLQTLRLLARTQSNRRGSRPRLRQRRGQLGILVSW